MHKDSESGGSGGHDSGKFPMHSPASNTDFLFGFKSVGWACSTHSSGMHGSTLLNWGWESECLAPFSNVMEAKSDSWWNWAWE